MTTCRNKPCEFCPYRRDVPSGIWDVTEYAKLPPYDLPTGEQPFGIFMCHVDPDQACTGWVDVGFKQPHDRDLLALRFNPIETPDFEFPVETFDTHTDAAVHGLRDIRSPKPAAQRAMVKLGRIVTARKK